MLAEVVKGPARSRLQPRLFRSPFEAPIWLRISPSSARYTGAAAILPVQFVRPGGSRCGPRPPESSHNSRKIASASAGSSCPGMITFFARKPHLRALSREACLPSGVVGPVERNAFLRFASICLTEVRRGGGEVSASLVGRRLPFLLTVPLIMGCASLRCSPPLPGFSSMTESRLRRQLALHLVTSRPSTSLNSASFAVSQGRR